MTNEASRTAGWYDDATDASVLRYWDGSAWSPHTAPRPADAAAGADAIDESTTVRPVEHTTVPLPPEHAAAASAPQFSYEPYRSPGRSFSAMWLFTLLGGAVVAIVIVAFAVR